MKMLKGYVENRLREHFKLPKGSQNLPETLWTHRTVEHVRYQTLVHDLTIEYGLSDPGSYARNRINPNAVAVYVNRLCDIHNKAMAKAEKDTQATTGDTSTGTALPDKTAGEPRSLIDTFAKASRTTKQANHFK